MTLINGSAESFWLLLVRTVVLPVTPHIGNKERKISMKKKNWHFKMCSFFTIKPNGTLHSKKNELFILVWGTTNQKEGIEKS